MKQVWLSVAVILLVAASLVAGTAWGQPNGQAHVRLVHASPDAPLFTVLIDDKPVFAGLSFGETSQYGELSPGAHVVEMVATGTEAPVVVSTTLTVAADSHTTVAVVGELADIATQTIADDNTLPDTGEARMRLVHLSPDSPAFDVVEASGAALFSDVAYGDVTDYTVLRSGTHHLQVRLAGTETVVADAPGLYVRDGSVYTLFVMGLSGAEPALRATPALDAAKARLRFVHASTGLDAVDVLVGGEPTFVGAEYGTVGDYQAIVGGEYDIEVVLAGTSEPVVMTTTLAVPGGDYTLLAVGVAPDVELLVLPDDNQRPEPGTAHLRFVHLSPDAPAVDVFESNGAPVFKDIGYKDVGEMLPMYAGTYELEVRLAGSDTAVVTFPDIVLAQGTTYTAFAVGLLSGGPALQLVVSVDAEYWVPDPGRARLVHAAPDTPPLDVHLGVHQAFAAAQFGEASNYGELPPGSYEMIMVPAGEYVPVIVSGTLKVESGIDYTVMAIGLLEEIEHVVLVDDNTLPAPGKAHVRFVHVSPDAPAIGVAEGEGNVLVDDLGYKDVSAYVAVDAGTHHLEVRLAGSDTVVAAAPGVFFRDGTVYSVFVMGLAEGDPVLRAVPTLDAGAARVRTVHASPGLATVDVYMEGNVTFDGVAFADVTEYTASAPGDYGMQWTPAGETAPVLITTTLSLAPGADYTVLGVGAADDRELIPLLDDNERPMRGTAHIRFVHASPDAPAVDVIANGDFRWFEDIGYKDVGELLALVAGRYDLEVRLTGTDNVVAEIPDVVLEQGTTYTVYLVGLVDGEPGVQVVVSIDASYYDVSLPLRAIVLPAVYRYASP